MAKRADTAQGTRIAVKVAAGAANNAISGWHDQYLKVRLCSVAERGKANTALIGLLAQTLGLSKSAITIVRGQHSAHKTLEVTGLSQADIMTLLQSSSSNR